MITERSTEAAELGISERIKVHDDPKSSKHKVPDLIAEVNDAGLYHGENYALKSAYMDILKNKATSLFMYLEELIEYDTTETIFLNPLYKQTEYYVSGKFG